MISFRKQLLGRNWKRILSGFIAVAAISFTLVFFSKSRSRSRAIQPALMFAEALVSRDVGLISELMLMPAALSEKSPTEQIQFVAELLESEISTEGLAVLAREGEFGPLNHVFPEEAENWTKPFSIKPEDCVAFRLARDMLIAELVLYRQPDGGFRVLRVNDIRQLSQMPTGSAKP